MDAVTTLPAPAAGSISEEVLRRIEKRVLWLAIRMVDHANRERPSVDSVKVGGHQASSASLVTVMTALWLCELQQDDRISVKPHASPVLHALEYLLGWLDEPYLRTLRDFGGLQAYPSRTKDPVPVDYSTGSVGLGAAAPLFGALVQRYVDDHGELGRARGRFISLIGDAELDEGNIWEAILDPATRGLSEAVWVIDLNRQSLDRVVPVIRADALERGFDSAGWKVVELKYGRRLRAAFAEPGGELLRRRIDEMPNQEYQQLFAASDDQIVEALERPLSAGDRRALARLLEPHQGAVGTLIRDLGGHDIVDVMETLAETRRADRPTAIFAYTIKGYGLPIAGHPLNHSAMLTGEHVEALRGELGLPAEDEWSRFPEGSPEAALCASAAAPHGRPAPHDARRGSASRSSRRRPRPCAAPRPRRRSGACSPISAARPRWASAWSRPRPTWPSRRTSAAGSTASASTAARTSRASRATRCSGACARRASTSSSASAR